MCRVLTIGGKQFTALLDTGTDTTCFSPIDWPTASSFDNVSGVVGSVKKVLISANKLVWQDEDGDTLVIPDLPINLWGRDIMEQMGVYVIKCKKSALIQQISRYTPTKGLRKKLQGITHPINPRLKLDRAGLGYNSPVQHFP